MGKLFGTDGIRGVTNREPMTSETALKVGQALGYLVRRKAARPRAIIGKDTRRSGYMLEEAMASGLTSMGCDVILVGPMPTPGIAFITENMDADCGIVISASHNPFEDNGIKIFFKEGMKLSDAQQNQIEELVFSGRLPELLARPADIGKVWKEEDARGRYIVFLKHTFPGDMNLEGMKVVLDCANGATYRVAPMLFTEMRATVTSVNTEPDGENINHNCGALYPEELAERVVREKADIGLAFDGDGDRFIASDEKGNIVTGDQVLAICARHLKDEGELDNNIVVSTVMSNIGFTRALKGMGVRTVQTRVGDRYVFEEMNRTGAVLGGEDSGHIIFRKFHKTGDGILTALQLIRVMKKEGKPLSELSKVMKPYPQVLLSVDVREKPDIEKVPEIKKAVEEVERSFDGSGRVLVRYSGTQNVCRVMVEGPSCEETGRAAEKIADAVRKVLGK
ncbi:MAG: phosphoglucosamine mutase [Candidatus Omnitrophica bacterium]|nr:phosphoglucosamine mutase [Candidatus Omnitrophota bacterium]